MSKYFWYLDENVGKGKESGKMGAVTKFEKLQNIVGGVILEGSEISLKASDMLLCLGYGDYSALEPFIDEIEEAVHKLRAAAHSLQVKANEETRERCIRFSGIKKAFDFSYGHHHKRLYPTVEETEKIKALIAGGYLGKCGM